MMPADDYSAHGCQQNLRMMVLVLVGTAGTATAQWDPTTGRIKPTAGVPVFDPAPWNSGYKVTFCNVPRTNSTGGGAVWPFAPVDDVNTLQECFTSSFDTSPASTVDVGACFYRNNTNGTFDFWRKETGLAFSRANCLCYALNRFEGDTCQPGTSNGQRGRRQYARRMTCPAMHPAIVDDGAVPVSRAEALTGQPPQGHYIAMLARATGCAGQDCHEEDFHLLRKDASGTWSWKLPNMPASDRDLEGRPITDPDTAPLPRLYTLCGYYRVEPAKMSIGSVSPLPGPLSDMSAVERYQGNPSVQVSIAPSPYNADKDGTPPERARAILAEDAAWERKRGTQQYADWKQQQRAALEVDGAVTAASPPSSSAAVASSAPSAPAGSAAVGVGQLTAGDSVRNVDGVAGRSGIRPADRGRKLKGLVVL